MLLLDAPPPSAAAGTAPRAASIRRWHVVHTRPRQEKLVAAALDSAHIQQYLPLRRRIAFSGSRKRLVQEPLFSGYLFMHGGTEAVYFATATRRIAGVIPVADQERLVVELAQVRRALEAGADLAPTGALTVGRRVRVTAGPFRDIEGLVDARPRPDRLVLQVDALGRAVALEIDASLLQPVD